MDTFAIGDFATLDGFKVAKSPIAKVSIRLLVLKISYPKRKLFRSICPFYGESYVAHGNQGKGIVETPDNGGSLIERQDDGRISCCCCHLLLDLGKPY